MKCWIVAPMLVAALAQVAFSDVVEHTAKQSAPSGLHAGVARADISPPVGIAHLNWGSQTHVEAIGIDPAGMWATALVISDGKQKFAIVDMDYHGITPDLEDAIRLASERTGIPTAHIRLNATHTHAGPNFQAEKGPLKLDARKYLPAIESFRRTVGEKVAGAIFEANLKLRPVHAAAVKGIGDVNVNRRVRATGKTPPAVGLNPEGFVDRELVVLRIDDAEGNPYAVVVNFQAHGTVLTFENKLVSPDWVGMVRKTVEQMMPGALCLYLQGAAGNQGPAEGATGDLTVAHRLGRRLGSQAAALALTIETVRREPVFEGYTESTALAARQPWRVLGPKPSDLRFARQVITVPRRTYTPEELDRMQSQAAAAKKKMEEVSNADDWSRHQADAQWRRFNDLLTKWRQPPDPTPLEVELQALRIGDMAIVAMPGEPFAEIGAAVKKSSPFAVTMFCGYSSGKGGGYMPVESEYAFGGYEVERSPYGTGAAKLVVDTGSALLQKLR
ncbi:MAG TPA: neutral/alkaline non-lysosomal ceramidase N-terminal domain-containing protein [Bryobacteraceae bacterium]|nr:neutral/alkaline non-lysosomal ceramidase N-terminal domain-containing protein [Bryobacteraceae bacterium]